MLINDPVIDALRRKGWVVEGTGQVRESSQVIIRTRSVLHKGSVKLQETNKIFRRGRETQCTVVVGTPRQGKVLYRK